MKLLIQSVNDLRAYVTFTGDLDYENVKPALRSAQEYMARYVGTELLDELQAEQLTDDQLALLPYVCVPIGNLALLKFLNAGNLRITDLGAMRTKTADSADAFEWQLDRVATTLKQEAFSGIEELLRYLESKPGLFLTYANSTPYLQQKGKLIPSATIFSQYYDISESRLILQTLSASMRTAEGSIRKLLGDNLPDLLGDDLSEEQAEQLDAARRALVYLTIARALREKLVSISDTGVQVCGISNFGTINYKQPASDKQLETSIRYFDKEAAGFMADLITLLTPPTSLPADTTTGSRIQGTKIIAF